MECYPRVDLVINDSWIPSCLRTNIALKAYIEKKKIAMGLGGEYGGQPETEDQANGRIHRTLESKFTTNARSRSVGRRTSAARPTNTRTDAKPGWMHNLGM